jgi:predicted DNA-binding protein (UPF0251 family)
MTALQANQLFNPVGLSSILEEMGDNIKLARLRRELTAEQVAERAGISRSTLWQDIGLKTGKRAPNK